MERFFFEENMQRIWPPQVHSPPQSTGEYVRIFYTSSERFLLINFPMFEIRAKAPHCWISPPTQTLFLSPAFILAHAHLRSLTPPATTATLPRLQLAAPPWLPLSLPCRHCSPRTFPPMRLHRTSLLPQPRTSHAPDLTGEEALLMEKKLFSPERKSTLIQYFLFIHIQYFLFSYSTIGLCRLNKSDIFEPQMLGLGNLNVASVLSKYWISITRLLHDFGLFLSVQSWSKLSWALKMDLF